jgi:hypothetical protein
VFRPETAQGDEVTPELEADLSEVTMAYEKRLDVIDRGGVRLSRPRSAWIASRAGSKSASRWASKSAG